jgi:hypothetical protein
MCRQTSLSPMPPRYESSCIKGYEFVFVVLISLTANFFASETLRSAKCSWFLLEASLAFASWHVFQIYRKLDSIWQEALREDDPIPAYRAILEPADIVALTRRLCFVAIFGLEAGACLLVRFTYDNPMGVR